MNSQPYKAPQSRRRRIRVRMSALTTVALALVACVAPAAYASVGGFEGGDGDQVSANCAAMLDWQCLSQSQLATSLDPSGESDLVFVGSNKEDEPDSWSLGTGNVQNKSEVKGTWSYSFADAGLTTNYLALGFKRASGTGDAYFGFELNQSNAKYVNSAGTSVVCRTNGDVIISYEISPSSAVALKIYKWLWNSGPGYHAPCTKGATGSFSSPVTLPAEDAELAVNAAPVDNYLSSGALGSGFTTGTFGETAINLTALANAVQPAATCEFFNHLQLTSRSSSSITSTMEDFVDGGSIVARACRTEGGGEGVSLPQVHITSPADYSVDNTSTVVLTGTSDQPEVEVFDGVQDVGHAVVNEGHWSLTLNNVADGQHAYTAVATNSAGSTPSNTVHVAVETTFEGSEPPAEGGGSTEGSGGSTEGSGGSTEGSGGSTEGSGGGPTEGAGGGPTEGAGGGSTNGGSTETAPGGSTGGTPTETTSSGTVGNGGGATAVTSGANMAKVAAAAYAASTSCDPKALVLTEVFPAGRATRLLGTAPNGTVGAKVKIISTWNGKVVAMPTVRPDLTFTASAALPPSALRLTNRARYVAKLAGSTSLALKFARRLYTSAARVKGRRVTFSGVVVRPLTSPVRPVIIRGSASCRTVARGPVLARVRPSRSGSFSATFAVPASLSRVGVVFLRAQTAVQKVRTNPRAFPTFSLIRGVRVGA
jgi:hypothetical protein